MKGLSVSQKKLALALGVAVIAAAGSWLIMENQQKKYAKQTRMVTVLKSRKFIPTGKAVEGNGVEEMPIPEAYVPLGALGKKDELVDSQGRPRFAAMVGIPKGEMLTRSLLIEPSLIGGLSWTLEPGRVAVSLRLNLEQAVTGHLQPGDFVNVTSFGQGKSVALLSHVRVVAVGDRVWDGVGLAVDFSKGLASEPVFVTLMMLPEESLTLNRAVNAGVVNLELVSPLIAH